MTSATVRPLSLDSRKLFGNVRRGVETVMMKYALATQTVSNVLRN
jgi:hypothetical protein